MVKRDPQKTAINKRIEAIKTELRALQPKVFKETKYKNEASLNARIGHKADHFIDLKNAVIHSPEEYIKLWFQGFDGHRSWSKTPQNTYDELYEEVKASPAFKHYLNLFLQRSYLNHHEELSKHRPTVADAEVWIGGKNWEWGLLVTPTWRQGDWQNDKSEIRAFRPGYWTIGHVLKTGLCVPGKKTGHKTFSDIEDYLVFFEHTLVRPSGSPYQNKMAERYCDFVRTSAEPEKIPLLLPELRYAGRTGKHEFRLDFCVIDPVSLDKYGFELSPWSTHGYLAGTKKKTVADVNKEALSNFEKETTKLKKFFLERGIYTLIYTDSDLSNMNKVWSDIEARLKPSKPAYQFTLGFIDDYFK